MNAKSRAMASRRVHISVCICTFRRPLLLRRLLNDLERQETAGRFVQSIVVVDNDRLQSAHATTVEFAATAAVPVTYAVEPRQNIALARNLAVATATGDFVAFIDDDEFPTARWLLTLLEAYGRFDVAGVLGPVKPHFDEPPPDWVVKGRFYDRASYPTGLFIDWRKGRTGNVLLERGLFSGETMPFRPEFLSGEDQDFFRRMIEKGHRFVWCDEAIAYEVVPPIRWKRTFMLKRALLRGATSLLDPEFGVRDIVKSVIAVPAYAVALPLGLVLGQHRFMNWLVRMFDHLGRLLALVGIRPIKVAYVTE